MTQPLDLSQDIDALSQLLHEKTGVSGRTFAARARKARRRLPRAAMRQARLIAEAEERLENPRLRVTLQDPRYGEAIAGLKAHLDGIDLAERRRGWWLGMLGGLAFNFLLAIVAAFVLLRVLGLI